VNEKALRRVIEGVENEKKVVGPDTSLWRTLKSLKDHDTVVMGNKKLEPTSENIAHIRELKKLYTGRNYLLDVKEGKTSIYLNKGCTPKIACLPPFRGSMWTASRQVMSSRRFPPAKPTTGLIKSSLSKTPADSRSLLDAMKKAGWSTELLRSHDQGKRVTWSGIPEDEEHQYELDLQEPGPAPEPQPAETK